MLTEADLINKMLTGDEKALKIFYDAFYSRLFRFINRKVSVREDAEEIAQDALLACLEGLRDFTGRSSLYTYLCSIANHKMIDYYRKKKIKAVLFSQLPEELIPVVRQLAGPEEKFDALVVGEQIKIVLTRIKPLYRRILTLKYAEGFSVLEIAGRLSLSFKSVESTLFRARTAFVREYRLLYL